LFAETDKDLVVKIKRCLEGMELQGLRVNMGKKVMCSKPGSGQVEKSRKWSRGVCQKGADSIICTVCKPWVYRRCSGLSGSLNIVVGCKCSRCVRGTGREDTMKEMKTEHVGKLECVSTFCDLEDVIGSGGGADEASRS
jgi:hypothetical protein